MHADVLYGKEYNDALPFLGYVAVALLSAVREESREREYGARLQTQQKIHLRGR